MHQKSEGDHSGPLSAIFLRQRALGTSTGAPCAVARCPSWSLGPLGPRNASSWLPGLAGGSGWAGCVPAPLPPALSWRVPRTVWSGQQLGNACHTAPFAFTISLLA